MLTQPRRRDADAPRSVRKLEGKSRDVDVAIFFMTDPLKHPALFQVLVVNDLLDGVETIVGTLGQREITGMMNSKMFSQRVIFSTFIPGIFSKSLKSRVTIENPKEMQVAPIIRS